MTVVNKAPLNHLIDQLLVDYKTPADIIGENGLQNQWGQTRLILN